MDSGVLQEIRSRGYWRVNFRPMVVREKIPTPLDCEEIVARNSVALRGWHYPSVLRGAPNVSRSTAIDHFELSDHWEEHLEFWRMYMSGQFIHLRGMREDWRAERGGPSDLEPGTVLAVVNTIYQVTEIYEFLARLTRDGIYDEGVEVRISVAPTTGRRFWLDDPGRVDFSYARTTKEPSLKWDRTHSRDEVIEKSREFARGLLHRWFGAFGWNPPDELLARDQEKLLTRNF